MAVGTMALNAVVEVSDDSDEEALVATLGTSVTPS